jgi:S-adenosylmethionine:tRNA ribosyltransferase-isomerase
VPPAAIRRRSTNGSTARAGAPFVKPAKRLSPGDVVRFGDEGRVCFLGQLDATVEAKGAGGEVTLSFAFHGPVLDQAVDERGAMPLPPYIASRRTPDERDRSDYQTVFAQVEGSVAAPTAGLHFTDALISRLTQRGIALHKVTLHVGAGTFLPVKAADTAAHHMHAERGSVSAQTADALNAARRAAGVSSRSVHVAAAHRKRERRRRRHPFLGDGLVHHASYRFRAVDVMMTTSTCRARR